MPALLSLPSELIYMVLGFVSKRDLLKVCLVNKALHDYCEPSIYSNIAFQWDHRRRPPIIELLQTLVRRPELFAYIETLSLEGHDHYSLQPMPLEKSQVAYAWWDFAAIVNTFNVPFTSQWVEQLWQGNMSAFVALLISRLSWATHLTITYNFVKNADLVGKVLQAKVFGGLPRFYRLKHMVYIHGVEFFANSPEHRSRDGMSLFYLPTVTNLAVWVRNPAVFSWPDDTPNLDHLTSLDIEGCCPTFVGNILALTPNLTSLAWSWHYAYNSNDPWTTKHLDLEEIISTLTPVKGTLERFQFRICIGSGYSSDFHPVIYVTGSFKHLVGFDRITHLDVPLVCLAGFGAGPQPLVSFVPHSVETLSLSTSLLFDEALPWMYEEDEEWPDQEVMDMLIELDDSHSDRLPRLRHINIVDEIDSFDINGLDQMLMENPISVSVDIVRRDQRHWHDWL
ncbi:unnamed protein product [Clonostachys rosea]|uniref:F-box domain-containing protein n=1 Tax=Bionectria ochroleuca TaxID=29856 RepID=A0ABY6UQU6_BIOOC|nr:unnamed protein product [Clonostachys rosea]